MFTKLILFVLIHSSTAAIRKLNASDYALMPPLYHLDNYEECFDNPDAIYCAAEFSLVSDEPSELLTMIREYSAFPSHFNRSLLRYGYCMHKTCKKFYNASGGDLRWSLEACANESLYNNYKLKAIVSNETDCSKRDRELPIDNLDISVGVICLIILLANLVGSICDRYFKKGRDTAGLRFLYCFSIFRNWKKLVASPGEGRDPRLKTLKGINGIRALTMQHVISSHVSFLAIIFIINPEDVEALYENRLLSVFQYGSLIMQTFLVISSFLLVYNWLIDSEKHPISWNMLPKQAIMRWLRLTPSYALTLGLTVTWFGRLSSGPGWKRLIYKEISDCRRDWWKHLFYINNYSTEPSTCMTYTWYLAADIHLYLLGVIIFLMCRTSFTRKVVLSILFVVGTIITSLTIYFLNLRGTPLGYPEMALNSFLTDATFQQLHIKTHTNMTGCAIGMALGYIVYYWQKSGGDPNQFRKYRFLYWTVVFWAGLCCAAGSLYNQLEEPAPVYVDLVIGTMAKPLFGICIAICIAGIIIQFEGVFRPILEWQPFMYLGRLSYSAYLLHIVLIRTEMASLSATHRFTLAPMVLKGLIVVMNTFIAAFFFYILVESPFGNLTREVFMKPNTHTKEDNKEAVEESKKAEDDKTTDLNQTIIEDGAILIKMGTRQ